jgi:hypothetical protein
MNVECRSLRKPLVHTQSIRKKHDKWRKVHECQTFVDIKRKDEKMDERSDDEEKNIINREKSMNAKLSLILRENMRKWMKEVMMKKKKI